jgi:hypothetical protein
MYSISHLVGSSSLTWEIKNPHHALSIDDLELETPPTGWLKVNNIYKSQL